MFMRNYAFLFGMLLTLVLGGMVVPQLASAQLTTADLGLEYADKTGLATGDVRDTISLIINSALGLLGIIAVVIFVYAGFLWMTAGGNDEQVGNARKMMGASVIGLAIILSAYGIARFVIEVLVNASA